MTLIKKSDVHNYLSTKSRERREKSHLYKPEEQNREANNNADTRAKATAENPVMGPERMPQVD